MKVILATPTWSLNGPNVFSANLVRGLRARHLAAQIVLTRPEWLDAKPMPRPPDIPFELLQVNRFMSFRARCNAMIRYLEKHSPCIYIPNHDFGHSCISPQLSNEVAIVGIVHSDDPRHYEHMARLNPCWNAVVAVSSAIAVETLRIAPAVAQRLSVIPYGIVTAASLPARCYGTQRPLRVIYAGRLDQPQKRILDLPEILQAAVDLDVPIELSIVGSGPAERDLKARFEAIAARHSVRFFGTVENQVLLGLLAEQDVFLLTSAFEGLPIALLEAMGQGCIPVVTDILSGVPELLEHAVNGFRVQTGDIQGFAARLAELYGNPVMRRQMATAAYAKARLGHYRLDRMVQSYVELFSSVLDETRRRAFHRPSGRIQPPPDLAWPEHLPGFVQRWGHYAKRLTGEHGLSDQERNQ
jgi:glycosyltransferase involved in cell wall biosynthesis